MGEDATREPRWLDKWRAKRRIRREERRRVTAEKALKDPRRDKRATKWGGPTQGG